MAASQRPRRPGAGRIAWGVVGAALLVGVAVLSLPQKVILIAIAMAFGAAMIVYGRPLWVVYLLAVLVPIEPVVAKFMPGPDQFALAVQFVGEAAIYGTLAIVLLKRALGRGTLRRTPLDIPLAVLLAVCLLSLLLNETTGEALLAGALNIRVLFRYVALFYLVVNLEPTSRQVRAVVAIVLVSGGFNLALGLLQWSVGGPFRTLFLPTTVDASFLGLTRAATLATRSRELGAVFGTTGDTLFFGLLMVVVTAVLVGRFRRLSPTNLPLLALLLLAVSLSFARATVLAWLLVVVVFYRWRHGLATALLATLLGILSLGLLIMLATDVDEEYLNPRRSEQSIVENLTGVFSRSYLARARNQRLGHLIGTAPTILASRPLLGYGPDQKSAIEAINTTTPSYLLFEVRERGFEDVYWVAILAYYGLAGVVAFAVVLFVLYRSAWRRFVASENPTTRSLAITVACMTGATAALMFFYRVPEFRIFGFYLWLFPALLYSLPAFGERTEAAAGEHTSAGEGAT